MNNKGNHINKKGDQMSWFWGAESADVGLLKSEANEHDSVVNDYSHNSDKRDAERYRWMKKNIEWRRHGRLADDDSHSFVGCKFPYLANFECVAMLDHNIDKMIENEQHKTKV